MEIQRPIFFFLLTTDTIFKVIYTSAFKTHIIIQNFHKIYGCKEIKIAKGILF